MNETLLHTWSTPESTTGVWRITSSVKILRDSCAPISSPFRSTREKRLSISCFSGTGGLLFDGRIVFRYHLVTQAVPHVALCFNYIQKTLKTDNAKVQYILGDWFLTHYVKPMASVVNPHVGLCFEYSLSSSRTGYLSTRPNLHPGLQGLFVFSSR